MGNKISYALKKCKSVLIVGLILWIILSIVFAIPVSVSWIDATVKNEGAFLEILMTNFENFGENLSKVFQPDYIGNFLKLELFIALGVLLVITIGLVKTMPKHDYADIEHGSSDWAAGEQYSILNKNKGILLAEKHYLPLDKRGNTNVLVVGRFRFW